MATQYVSCVIINLNVNLTAQANADERNISTVNVLNIATAVLCFVQAVIPYFPCFI